MKYTKQEIAAIAVKYKRYIRKKAKQHGLEHIYQYHNFMTGIDYSNWEKSLQELRHLAVALSKF
jgi:hypothetical protein